MIHPKRKYRILVLLLICCLFTDTTAYARTKNKKAESDLPYSLNITEADILLGDSISLSVDGITDENVSFKSSDNSIVSLTPDEDEPSCECNSESIGNATVTIKIRQKGFLFFNNTATTLNCQINVSPKATSIQFNRKKIRMTPNTRQKIKITLRPSITKEVPVLTSSNPKVVKITKSGNRIRAKAPGTAVITATIRNGNTAACLVIVTDKILSNKKS